MGSDLSQSGPASLKIASRSFITNGFVVSPASTTPQGIKSSGLIRLTKDVVGHPALATASHLPAAVYASMQHELLHPDPLFSVLALIYNGRILWRRRPPHPRRSATGRLAEAEEIAGANEAETDSL